MELEKSIFFKINTFACKFRSLNESDVTEKYIDGLREQKEYLENAPISLSVSGQKKYINDMIVSEGDTICGLFLNQELVGSTRVQLTTDFSEYVDDPEDYVAAIGIFFSIEITETSAWVKLLSGQWRVSSTIPLRLIGLVRDRQQNISPLKSFLSCGTRKVYEDKEILRVLLHFYELMKPDCITDEVIREVDQPARSRSRGRLS